MGWKTYHQVITELSPSEWIYSDLTSYVITHRKQELIDQFYISIIPTLLGSGIHLFGTDSVELKLKLTQSRHYNGIIEMIYEKRCYRRILMNMNDIAQ